MATEVKYRVTLEENASRGLNKADKSAQRLDRSMSRVKSQVAGAISIYAAFNLGKHLINAASDAEEAESKFGVVFGNVITGANSVAKELTESYGLSSNASKQLLSDTGDLLTGFGFSGKQALGLSEDVNKLSVDLASFTNFEGGAEGASQALTKALLGERESVKSLGIAILDSDVKARVKQMESMGKLTGLTNRQKQAYATLKIAQEQSKNAIGDFARTQDGFANRTRILSGELDNLSVELGNRFLKAANKGAKGLVSLTKKATSYVKIGLDEKIKDERKEVLRLTSVIQDSNVTRENQLKALNQLKTIAPQVAKDVEIESGNYEKLNKNLDEYLVNVVKRISIAKLEEKRQDALNDLSDLQIKRTDLLIAGQESLVGVSDKYRVREGSLQEQLSGTLGQLAKRIDVHKILSGGLTRVNRQTGQIIETGAEEEKQYRRINAVLSGYSSLQAKSRSATKNIIAPINNQIALLNKMLGINKDVNKEGIKTGSQGSITKEAADQITKITAAAPKVFNITIGNLVEEFNVNSSTITESTTEVKDIIIEAFIGGLNDVQLIGNV